MTVVIGVDLGHDTVRIAALVEDRPVAVTAFPALAALDGAQVVVGRAAAALAGPRRAVPGAPAEQLAWLVRAGVLAAEAAHGPVQGAVLTVPPDAGALERRALRDAAAVAGIPVTRLLATPVAIALALPSAPDGRWLVCDAGAAGFAVTVVDRLGGAIERLATAVDPELGGRALDRLIAEHLARAIDQPLDGAGGPWLVRAAAALKENLGNAAAAEAALVNVLTAAPPELRALRAPRRDELELWMAPRIRKLDEVCARALSAAGLMSSDLSEVVLAGSGARTLAIAKRLGQVMGRPARLPADAGFAAALGAARAARMFVAEPAALVVDVVPHPLALGAGTTLTPLVAAGAVLPTREGRLIPTRKDGETTLEVELWEQGATPRPVGRWRVRDLPVAPAGDALALCNVTVDADGVPRLEATELVSGAALPVVALEDPGLDAATLAACKATVAEWRPT